MLREVLDENITHKLVRLGSRSSDERIAEYTLDKIEQVAGRSTMNRAIGRQYGVMKDLEEQMAKVMQSIQEPALSIDAVRAYLDIHYPEHAESLENPPFWVGELANMHWKDEEEHGEWQTQDKKKEKERKKEKADGLAKTMYAFWKGCVDLQYITPQMAPDQPPQVDERVQELFVELGYGGQLPPVPLTTRQLTALLEEASAMWSMSPIERAVVSQAWEEDMRMLAYTNNLQEYEKLRDSYREACKEYNDIRDEVSFFFQLLQSRADHFCL